MYKVNNENNLKEDLALIAQRNARVYRREVAKKRKIEKCKRIVAGVIFTAFFVTGLGIVGKNDLESEGVVLAKESKTEVTHTLNGKIMYKNLIETEEGYRWGYDTDLPEGTEVTVEFNDNGTINPIDDVVLEVTER